MKCDYSCNSEEHSWARRQFLGGLAGGLGFVVGGLGAIASPAATKKLGNKQQRILLVDMRGGLSQLESWDPKPKTDTGGPFRAIPTAVPGIHISELLPKTAVHMDKLALVRSIDTNNKNHSKGRYQMTYGRDERPGVELPHLGAVCAKALTDVRNPLPGHIRIPGGGRGSDSAYLGPKYSSIGLDGKPPANSSLPSWVTPPAEQSRNELRRRMNDRFTRRRRTAETDLYTYSYEQARELMTQRDIFDVSLEPKKEIDRYGDSEFGRHCLLARRLLENGITFVQISHSNYDTHNENFNFHLEQLGEFDHGFGNLIQDLHDRGMMDSTLVVVLSEFGRTPKINARFGRDHWGTAWSICLGGARIQPGAVVGATNENGTEVSDRKVNHGNLFHTYLAAVGLDPTDTFDLGNRTVPMADPAASAIDELIA